uniref:LEM domain containing 1 n=1 Tax=Canis lupus familiaris TaxID=9615 RepID=A0A8I3SA86_CANLF
MVDVKSLSDYELQNELNKLGFSPGPILQLNVTIILKGNIILSSEKNKALKKRLEASITNPEALDIYYLAYKHPEGIRFPNRASNTRFEGWSCIRETDYCPVNRSVEFGNLEILPVGLKLAVFGIFIIVIFVYITVEKEPFFG